MAVLIQIACVTKQEHEIHYRESLSNVDEISNQTEGERCSWVRVRAIKYIYSGRSIAERVCACLTAKAWQNTDVGLVEQRQSIVTDVKMREVRDEIVPHQEAH